MRTAESVVLTDWPPGPDERKDVDAEVRRVDLHVHLLRLGQDRHRRRRGVDPALAFGLGDPLDAVHAGLVAQAPIGPPSPHGEDRLPDRPRDPLRTADQLHRPPPPLGESPVHPHQVRAEESRLVASGACADLDHRRAVLHRVGRHQRGPEPRFGLLEAAIQFRDLGPGKRTHLGIVRLRGKLPSAGHLRFERGQLPPGHDRVRQSRPLPAELPQPGRVPYHLRVRKLAFDSLESVFRGGRGGFARRDSIGDLRWAR